VVPDLRRTRQWSRRLEAYAPLRLPGAALRAFGKHYTMKVRLDTRDEQADLIASRGCHDDHRHDPARAARRIAVIRHTAAAGGNGASDAGGGGVAGRTLAHGDAQSLGGPPGGPLTCARVIEEVAQTDSSAGWADEPAALYVQLRAVADADARPSWSQSNVLIAGSPRCLGASCGEGYRVRTRARCQY
jgi:hypothetical protein